MQPWKLDRLKVCGRRPDVAGITCSGIPARGHSTPLSHRGAPEAAETGQVVIPPTYSGASAVATAAATVLRRWLSRVVGSPPSTERFSMWLKVSSSTVWNWPSFTVSALPSQRKTVVY